MQPERLIHPAGGFSSSFFNPAKRVIILSHSPGGRVSFSPIHPARRIIIQSHSSSRGILKQFHSPIQEDSHTVALTQPGEFSYSLIHPTRKVLIQCHSPSHGILKQSHSSSQRDFHTVSLTQPEMASFHSALHPVRGILIQYHSTSQGNIHTASFNQPGGFSHSLIQPARGISYSHQARRILIRSLYPARGFSRSLIRSAREILTLKHFFRYLYFTHSVIFPKPVGFSRS
jgi:hypothetical protein